MDMLPKESAQFVMSISDHVTIDTNSVKELATRVSGLFYINFFFDV